MSFQSDSPMFQYEPKRIDVKAMALLFVNETQTGASGRIQRIRSVPAKGYFLVNECHADLAIVTIVAVPSSIWMNRCL